MRRCCLVLLSVSLLFSLFACGGSPQTVQLLPFSAALSFSQNDTDVSGTLTVENAQTMRLLLSSPAELKGAECVLENGEAVLRFGEASLSLGDAERLSLPPTAVKALFEALSILLAVPQTPADGVVEAATSRGTAKAVFSSEFTQLLRVEIGDIVYTFANVSAGSTSA